MAGLPEAFTDAIRDRYVVELQIGSGGMADVYLARDLRHGRAVAIKVLKPELAASLAAERFLKEIAIAARLTHPHIVPLHDSGEAAGHLYFVMPYIDGESLRARLRRETRLAPEDALAVVAPVGDALSYAHRHGVLHRDIKPENILFAEGHPMLADFGIARAVRTAEGASLTRTGLAVGTPGYMSPEQAAGERELDARSDLYSLACVLYEMLVGEPPGMWQPDASLRVGRFTEVSEQHRMHLGRAGGAVEAAMVRALAVRARERFGGVDAFLEALRSQAPEPRRYGDGEVREIVRRAAEDQVAHPTGEGLSLRTVQEIAGEVGIPPERVERAVRELGSSPALSRGPAGADTAWLGSPLEIAVEHTVEGAVPSSLHDAIVDEIQAAFSTEGQVTALGGSLTWRTLKPVVGKRRAVQVRVTSRSGETRIEVKERLGEMALTLYSSILVGGGIGGVATILAIGAAWLGHGLEAGVLSAGWLAGAYAVSRWVFRLVARRKHTDLERLAARIASLAQASTPDRLGDRPTPRLPPG